MPKKSNKPAQKWNYICTFERGNDPPITVRGEVEGTAFPTAAQRAVKDARKQAKRVRANAISLVVERNDGTNDFKI